MHRHQCRHRALISQRQEISFPNLPGYLGVGVVEKAGPARNGFSEGDRVFYFSTHLPEPYASNSWMGTHASHAVVPDRAPDDWPPYVCKIPDGIDDGPAAMAGLASVSARGAGYFAEATGADAMFVAGLKTLAPNGQAVTDGAPEKFIYTLDMKGAPGDFAVRVVGPEEYKAYDWVCELVRSGRIDTSLFRSHTWQGLEQLPRALEEQSSGKVVKGFVRI